ncbi:MAG: hypothetical protein IPN90_01840 [Elusimicrobia bacterium]|nr:hypothetical protein [Elusimicrobiota bacterium]
MRTNNLLIQAFCCAFIIAAFLSVVGCVEFESEREVALRKAQDYRNRGFSMNATDMEKDAQRLSDKEYPVITLPDASD